MPTLTYNTIGRHISRVCRTRVCSAVSPWAKHESVINDSIQLVPISHGEGRIIISPQTAKELFKNGQVFTQYVDEQGKPAIKEPHNPNGSMYAIEGITRDGRILVKWVTMNVQLEQFVRTLRRYIQNISGTNVKTSLPPVFLFQITEKG